MFGKDSLTYRPSLEATTQNDLVATAHYIHFLDPIPTLHSPSYSSDAGIAVEYKVNNSLHQGFFGFVKSTQNFTWIPSATIVRQDDGTKDVIGEKGIMELKGIQLQEIKGDPNITISTLQGGIFLDSKLPINISPALNIGTAGSISQTSDGKDLIISSFDGNVGFSVPHGDINIPAGTTLNFSDTTSITGGKNGGLLIISSEQPVSLQSDLVVPTGNTVTMGNAVFSTTPTDIKLSGTDTVTLAPNNSIQIPDDVFLQIGDLSKTGFVGHQGTLAGLAVSDITYYSGGNISTTAQGNLNFTASGGVTNLNSTHVYLPAKAEIAWSDTNTFISTIPNGTLNIHSESAPINVSSKDNVTIATPVINLTATTSVNVPNDIPLQFGTNGAKIVAVSADGQLHINNANGVVIDRDLVIAGGLTVYGPTTEISSTTTVIKDPIISLGSSGMPEYIKDRGIQFYYGDGKLGFMGFGQEEGRFYLIKDGTNTNEVFTKENFGDLQVNRIFADTVYSSGGFAVSIFHGAPFLNIDATWISLDASEYIKVPETIPIQFGSAANSILWNR